MALALLLARSFGVDGVPLHAQRRGLKSISAAAVVKCIENDFDLVIVVDVFPRREAGPHLMGIVVTDEDNVQVLLVVAQVGFGTFGNAFAIVGVALRETRHL